MLNHEAYSSYHSTNLDAQVTRASPIELVLVLTDGLLEELARARGHIVGKRYELKANSLNKCTDIINGLASSLDFDNGGEVVENLGRLYDYCAGRLYTAGVSLDPTIIDEVTTLLTTIKKGWLGVQAKMDRQRALLHMAQKMSAALAAQDWKTLAALNTLMVTALPQMAAQGNWNSSERAALSALRQLHEEAVRTCNAAAEDLERRLHEMQANKEGWLAYALDSEQLETGIQA